MQNDALSIYITNFPYEIISVSIYYMYPQIKIKIFLNDILWFDNSKIGYMTSHSVFIAQMSQMDPFKTMT